MALTLNDSSLVVAARGSIFIAPANTPLPAGGFNDFAAAMNSQGDMPSEWERVVNTSRENLPAFEVESGEATQLGSWDNPTVRTVYGVNALRYTFNPMQHDTETIARMLNGWAVTGSAVMASTNWDFTAAIAIVIFDGNNVSGFYIPNNDVTATSLPTLALDAFSELQVTCTAKPAAVEAIPVGPDGRTGLLQIMEPTAYVAPVGG